MRKVDVGGFRLAIYCRGQGSPTVILESEIGSNSGAWSGTEPKIARTTRVCSYDRAGLGNSDARRPAKPETVPATRVVRELHALLKRGGIRPPYVLGGLGFGGFLNRLYAKRYPSEVVGLVSLDGSPIGLPGNPLPAPPGYPPQEVYGTPYESYVIARAGPELAKRPTLGTRPFIVLTHGSPGPASGAVPDVDDQWLKWQKEVARLSKSSMLVRAEVSVGGTIHITARDLTAEAFRLVVVAARRHAPLPRCAATRLPSMFGTCLRI